jgi:hypothetical protein
MDSSIPNSVPRAYQNEIFHQAIRKNVIAVMGTGTGKTLIACMLIQYMHALPVREGMRKKASSPNGAGICDANTPTADLSLRST